MFAFLKRKARRSVPTRRGETLDLSPPDHDGNVHISDQTFEDCHFHKSGKWPFVLAGCHFKRCTFRLQGSLNKHFTFDCVFEDCTFVFRGVSRLWMQNGERLIRCRFEGVLRGGRFDAQGRTDMIEALDMRDLKFDMISFRGGADPAEVSLPPWPSFATREMLPKGDPRLAMFPEEIRTLIPTPRPGECFAFNLERMKAGEAQMWPALRHADWVRVDA